MNPASILVVDDDEALLTAVEQCLRGYGYEVTAASGGRRAIAALQEREFDVVITDVLMPDADGMEVMMAAKRVQPNVRMIVMTGGGEYLCASDLLRLGKAVGAMEELQKPFLPDVLVNAVERVCGRTPVLVGAA